SSLLCREVADLAPARVPLAVAGGDEDLGTGVAPMPGVHVADHLAVRGDGVVVLGVEVVGLAHGGAPRGDRCVSYGLGLTASSAALIRSAYTWPRRPRVVFRTASQASASRMSRSM